MSPNLTEQRHPRAASPCDGGLPVPASGRPQAAPPPRTPREEQHLSETPHPARCAAPSAPLLSACSLINALLAHIPLGGCTLTVSTPPPAATHGSGSASPSTITHPSTPPPISGLEQPRKHPSLGTIKQPRGLGFTLKAEGSQPLGSAHPGAPGVCCTIGSSRMHRVLHHRPSSLVLIFERCLISLPDQLQLGKVEAI